MNTHTPDESTEKQLDKIIADVKTNNEIIEEIANDAAAKAGEEEKDKKEE
ncbi:MAG: hypothetical protein JWR50_3090 [Mucilaginibacter sp.]|nr:hypothetical protein [Mucilaginibacter sp.]